MNKHLLVVVGSTSSGKSDMAVDIALRTNGEIVSADSRQVYKGLDIGSGKITKEEMRGVPHYMLDIVDAKDRFTVQQYKTQAEKVIKEIHQRKKAPILCGGTGFYISTVVDNIIFPEVEPDSEFRKEAMRQDKAVLFEELRVKDPERADSIDPNNKQRIIRALEIIKDFGAVPQIEKKSSIYDKLILGLKLSPEELKERIEKRLLKRLENGMIEEARRLNSKGLPFERMEELGLEYRFLARHLKGDLNKEEMIEKIKTASWQYAKRQKTWFQKDSRINWFHPIKEKDKIFEVVDFFLKNIPIL